MHETILWFKNTCKKLPEFGFKLMDKHIMPKHFWWTNYGAPLEKRIRAYRKLHCDASDSPKLAEHENVVASIKNDPDGTDCGIYLVKRDDLATIWHMNSGSAQLGRIMVRNVPPGSGTMCGREIQGTHAAKIGNCEKCAFYHSEN
jgi:hypothetical protein